MSAGGKKWFIRALIALVAGVTLLLASITILLRTEAGTRWIFARVDGALEATLTAEGLDGTLLSGVSIGKFRYADDKLAIAASNVFLNIDWWPILGRTLLVRELHVTSLRLQNLEPGRTEPQPFTLSMAALPLQITLDRVEINTVEFATTDAATTVKDIDIVAGNIFQQHIVIERANASIANLTLAFDTVAAELAGDVPLSLNIEWQQDTGQWSGAGALSGSLAELAVQHTIAGPFPAELDATATVLDRMTPELRGSLSWDTWLFDEARLTDGSVEFQGTLADYNSVFSLEALLPAGDVMNVSGNAVGNLEQLTAFDITATGSLGDLGSSGTLTWAPALAVIAELRASGLDPSAFVAELQGNLGVTATIEVDAERTVFISDGDVDGTFNGAPISANLNGSFGFDRITCSACRIEVGENQVFLDGVRDAEEIAFDFSVAAPQLVQLWPGLHGSLTGEGVLRGASANPDFSGSIDASEIGFDQWQAASVNVESRGSTAEEVDLSIDLTSLSQGENDYGSLKLAGQGAPDDLEFSLEWAVRNLDMNAGGTVTTDDSGLTGLLRRASVEEANTGTWRLTSPVTLELRGDDFDVSRHSWRNAQSELSVERLLRQDGRTEMLGALREFPLQTLNSWLPEDLELSGLARANVDVAFDGDRWAGNADWQQENTLLTVARRGAEPADINVPEFNIGAQLDGGAVAVRGALRIDSGVTGSIELNLASVASDAEMTGQLRLNGDEWSWVTALAPAIDDFSGGIDATLNANGSISAPQFSGALELSNGQLAVPALNVPLRNANLSVIAERNGELSISGEGEAGDGDIGVSGRVQNFLRADRLIELRVTGDTAEVINWPDYHVWASPELDLRFDGNGFGVDGEILVPRAEIQISELPEDAIVVSEDVTVIGREPDEQSRARISGSAQLTLGDAVHVRAFGLDTNLAGDLRMRFRPGRDAVAEGEVNLVDGFFSAYGQRLTITEGTLTFTGDLEDPLVDVRAVRVVETFEGQVTAGIHVRGRSQTLTSTVYSEPSMPEADALSYLVIGRPLAQATASDGSELSNAAIALGARQASRVTQQLGQALGLDQLSVTGDGGDATALVAGKQINSRLHARYAYGVFSRLGTLLLKYRLTRRLTLEAGAGEEQSIDLLYQVEKQ